MSEFISIELLHELYRKLYKINTTDLLDLILSIYISHHMEKFNPLWLFIVGPSSAGKTMNTDILKELPAIYPLSRVTPRTFISGNPGTKDGIEDMNNKVILISDFGQFLSLRSEDKQQLWAQLREVYDGELYQEYGTGKKVKIKDIHISMIVNATNAIDNQITLFQQLGTREIMYRVEKEELPPVELTLDTDGPDIKKQMGEAIRSFFEQDRFKSIIFPDAPETIKKEIIELSKFVSCFRASAPVDSFTGELRGEVVPEHPIRLAKTLLKTFRSLAILDNNRSPEQILKTIIRVAFSSANKNRITIFKIFLSEPDKSLNISQISRSSKLGKKTVNTELKVLHALGIMNYREELDDYGRVLFAEFELTSNGKIWMEKIKGWL